MVRIIRIKRKVTLKTKVIQPEDDVSVKVSLKRKQPETQLAVKDGSTGDGERKKRQAKIVLVALLVAIFGGVGYYLYNTNQADTTKSSPIVATTGRTDVLKETAQAAQSNSAAEVAKAETGEQTYAGQAGNAADNKSQNVTSANADKASVENVSVKADTKKQATSSANSNASDINVSATTPSSSVQETANEVLKGVYGNGVTRKHKLGSRYAEVQRHVNEMYRNGFVH